jgi:hypothetical protein
VKPILSLVYFINAESKKIFHFGEKKIFHFGKYFSKIANINLPKRKILSFGFFKMEKNSPILKKILPFWKIVLLFWKNIIYFGKIILPY